MRGIVLLAVGVLLIWLGATTSRNASEAAESGDRGRGADATRSAEAPAARPGDLAAGSPAGVEPQAPQAGPDSAAPAAEEPESSSGGAAEEAERAAALAANPAADLEREDARVATPGGDAGTEREPSAPPASRPRSSSDDVGPAPPDYRLGGPGENPTQLAALLLESWAASDPTALEEYLNDSDRELSTARRRLVAAFWQAVAGDPDAATQAAEALAGAEGVTTAQVALLRAAGDPGPRGAVPAAASRRDPLARAMRMVLLQDRAVDAERTGEVALAAGSWSDLVQLELDAEWPPHRALLREWTASLNAAQERYRLDPDGPWPSLEVEVLANDNLSGIRQRIVHDHPHLRVSVDLLRRLNRVGKFIHPGDVLRVPVDVPNVIVDLDARLVVYRHGTEAVLAWECGIGKEGHETPPGTYEIGLRQKEPAYMPAGRQALPFGHEDNPLGTRWLAWHLDGKNTSYGLHGTWDPDGVGERVSQGCVRMRNEEVEVLYDLLPLGTQVLVQP